jgi:small subunit ribosomal protein S1
VECQVLSVDEDRKRIALGLKQLAGDPWETTIPEKYQPGALAKGTVTKITNFGVFVELESELEGLLHISELADHKVENPEDEVEVGEEIEVRILRVDTDERKIGLSRRLDAELPVEGEVSGAGAGAGAGDADRSDAPRKELKGGIGGSSAPLFSMDSDAEPEAEESAPEAEEVAEPSAESADAVEEVVAEETEEAPPAESDTAEETAEPAAETVEAEESDQADEPAETDDSESADEEEKQE